MASSQTLVVGVTFTSSTIGWILCAVIIYFACRFYKFRFEQPLQKRYPPLVYLITVSIVFYIGLSQSLMMILWLYETENYPLRILDLFFYSFSLHGTTIAMISRAWMIYFNIKWGLQTQKAKWTIHIHPGQVSSFWFIKHKKDYGSLKYIKIFAFSYYISVGMFLFVLRSINKNYQLSGYELLGRILDILLYLIEIITLIIIWNKIPSFADTLGIKSELKYALRYTLCALITYIVWMICVNIENIPKWTLSIFTVAIYVFVAMLALTFNFYIFWSKYRHLISSYSDVAVMLDIQNEVTTSGRDRSKSNDVDLLPDTLQNEQLFQAFFEHLSDEFSSELLLSYIEFVQFKKLMQRDGVININGDQKYQEMALELPSPPSYIVFECHKNVSNNIAKYILIAIDLFNKYINHSSDFEINISFGDRNQVTSFINKYRGDIDIDSLQLTEEQQNKLYSLYDNCIKNVYELMTFSHARYTDTTRYTSIKTII